MKTKEDRLKNSDDDNKNSERQARAQLDTLIEMVQNLESDDDDKRDAALQTIHENALSIEVRTDWYLPGTNDNKPTEYCILLCTGGPAVRIIGDLSEHGEPETATLEHQDWFTPWKEYNTTTEEEAAMLRYASTFYFGE